MHHSSTLRKAKLNSVVSILFVLVMVSTEAQSPMIGYSNLEDITNLKWKISNADDSTMSALNYDDSAWLTVATQKVGQFDTLTQYHEVRWYRFRFNADSTLSNKTLALEIYHEGASEIYIDGIRVARYGKIGNQEAIESYNPKADPLIIPPLSEGEHTIAVRYADRGLPGNFYRGFSLKLEEANSYIHDEGISQIAIAVILISISLIFLSLGLLHFFFFMFHTETKSNLYFSLFMFGASGIFLTTYITHINHDVAQETGITIARHILSAITFTFFTTFIHDQFKGKNKFWFLAIVILGSLVAILSLINTDWNTLLIPVMIGTSAMHGIILIIKSMIRKVKGSRIIGSGILFTLIFFIVLFIFLSTSSSIQITADNWPGKIILFFTTLATLSIPISMSIYQAWKHSQLNNDLSLQLIQVKELSRISLEQEQEKKRILENQNIILEQKVAERTFQLSEEKHRSDELLLNILPAEVAEELKAKGSADAKHFDEVTVMFTDFKGFTNISEKLTPTELVAEIDACFKAFDVIIGKYHIEKIKTIGDSYMCAAGLPLSNATHATDIVNAALEVQHYIGEQKKERIKAGKDVFEIRIGIHTGPVVAGIVGIKKFAYDIWGDTVNTASRLESSGEIGRINISSSTYEKVKEQFNCIPRGLINAKNKGAIEMYFVDGKK